MIGPPNSSDRIRSIAVPVASLIRVAGKQAANIMAC
jgi:hypothetical protein